MDWLWVFLGGFGLGVAVTLVFVLLQGTGLFSVEFEIYRKRRP